MKLHMQILIALGLGLKRNCHIFFGIIAGIFLGIYLHAHPHVMVDNILTFIGQVFIRLIQMVVIPLVVSAIIIGITSIGDNKQLGKFGSKMVLYYGIKYHQRLLMLPYVQLSEKILSMEFLKKLTHSKETKP